MKTFDHDLPYSNLGDEIYRGLALEGRFTRGIPDEISLYAEAIPGDQDADREEGIVISSSALSQSTMRNIVNLSALGFDSDDVNLAAHILLSEVESPQDVSLHALSAQLFEVLESKFCFTPDDESKMIQAATLIKGSADRYLKGVCQDLTAHGFSPESQTNIGEMTLEALAEHIETTGSLASDGLSLDALMNRGAESVSPSSHQSHTIAPR